jgi:hypothetical protein
MVMMVIIIIIIIIIIEPRVIKLNMIKPFFIRERFLDRKLQLVSLKMLLILPSCTSLPPCCVNREYVPLILTNICITFISGERRRFLISFFPECYRPLRRTKISNIQRRKLCIWFLFDFNSWKRLMYCSAGSYGMLPRVEWLTFMTIQ